MITSAEQAIKEWGDESYPWSVYFLAQATILGDDQGKRDLSKVVGELRALGYDKRARPIGTARTEATHAR